MHGIQNSSQWALHVSQPQAQLCATEAEQRHHPRGALQAGIAGCMPLKFGPPSRLQHVVIWAAAPRLNEAMTWSGLAKLQ